MMDSYNELESVVRKIADESMDDLSQYDAKGFIVIIDMVRKDNGRCHLATLNSMGMSSSHAVGMTETAKHIYLDEVST